MFQGESSDVGKRQQGDSQEEAGPDAKKAKTALPAAAAAATPAATAATDQQARWLRFLQQEEEAKQMQQKIEQKTETKLHPTPLGCY